MKRFSSLFCLTALTAAVLTGCGTKPAETSASLPDWVMAPMVATVELTATSEGQKVLGRCVAVVRLD